MLTVTDLFCGAGGSSTGAETVPGVRVRMASNHWDLAIETHNTNLPHVDHDIADIAGVDPHRYPATDILWASPECTYWSQARGEKQDYAVDTDQSALFGEDARPLPAEAAQRSRALMQDVPRFADIHHYKAIIVENVPDILKWTGLPDWIGRMRRTGYRCQVLVLNSAFAHQLGAPAPQLRERAYFLFTLEHYPAPDLNRWTRPRAWCPSCQQIVTAVQALRKPGSIIGRAVAYGRQYDYRCPSLRCRNTIALPYVLPAAAAIDWSVPGERIGDRARPLAPKTMARIEAGLRRYGRPPFVEVLRSGRPRACSVQAPLATVVADGSAHYLVDQADAAAPFVSVLRTHGGNQPITQPMRTVVAGTTAHALVVPVEGREGKTTRPALVPLRGQTTRNETGLLVPAGGTWNTDAQPVARPMRTRTTRETEGVLVIPLRNHNQPKPISVPVDTGNHHALLMRNNTPRGDAGQMCTPVSEPARTLTTAGHQSLVWHPNLLLAYDTGTLRGLDEPLPTQTTIEGDALVQAAIDVDDCLFRMLMPDEIKLAMAFDPGFLLLGTKREQVRLAGNAVTPPAARDLIAAVVEAITGDEVVPA